jgi:hypothetical protein
MDRTEIDQQVAERVRAALIACAEAAHEDARLRGLCGEGAWEAAVVAMRVLPLDGLLGATPSRAR